MSKQETQTSFSQILENTLQFKSTFASENQQEQNFEWSSNLDPMYLSYLLGTIEINQTSPHLGRNNPYLKYKKVVVIPDHVLTQTEQSAFEFINSHLNETSQLNKKFHIAQLKRAYKKAALYAHPDCGGSHERFLTLKAAYELLVAFLNSVK